MLLSIAVIVSGAVAPYQPASLAGTACACAVYVVIWCSAWLRDREPLVRWRTFRASPARAAPSEPAGVATASSAEV